MRILILQTCFLRAAWEAWRPVDLVHTLGSKMKSTVWPIVYVRPACSPEKEIDNIWLICYFYILVLIFNILILTIEV